MDTCSVYEQSIGICAKLATRAAYLGGCFPIEKVMLLCTDKCDKDRWIVCGFVRGCFVVVDVRDSLVVTVFH